MSEIKIPTAFGPVTEYARKQAAENIKEDAALRAKVMEIILREVSKPKPEEELIGHPPTEEEIKAWEENNKVLAEAEFARRYPEASLP
jgi:hypothetical protein